MGAEILTNTQWGFGGLGEGGGGELWALLALNIYLSAMMSYLSFAYAFSYLNTFTKQARP